MAKCDAMIFEQEDANIFYGHLLFVRIVRVAHHQLPLMGRQVRSLSEVKGTFDHGGY